MSRLLSTTPGRTASFGAFSSFVPPPETRVPDFTSSTRVQTAQTGKSASTGGTSTPAQSSTRLPSVPVSSATTPAHLDPNKYTTPQSKGSGGILTPPMTTRQASAVPVSAMSTEQLKTLRDEISSGKRDWKSYTPTELERIANGGKAASSVITEPARNAAAAYVDDVRKTAAARGMRQAVQAEEAGKTDNSRYGQYLKLLTPEEREKATKLEVQGGLSETDRGAYIRSLNLDERLRERKTEEQNAAIAALEAAVKSAKASKDSAGERYAAWAAGEAVISPGRGEEVPMPGTFRVLTQKERDTFKAYADAKDFQAVNRYYEALEPVLKERYAQAQTEAFRDFTENSTLASVASVPLTGVLDAFGGIPGYAAAVAGNIKDAVTGDYTPIDPNSDLYLMPRISQAMQEGRENRIATIENEHVRKLAHLAASGFSSGISNLAQMATGAALGLQGKALAEFVTATMSASAGGQAAYQNLNEGQSNISALVNATANAAIEYWTEHMTTSMWIENLGKLKSGKLTKAGLVKMLATQTGAEMWEEVVGNIADQSWDRLYNGENSVFQKRVEQLIGEGMSREEASREVFKELYVDQSTDAALSVAFSMLLMDGAPALANHVSYADTGRRLWESEGAKGVNLEIEKGLLFPESPAYRQAVKVGESWDNGKGRVNQRDLGRLAFLNAQEELELVADIGDSGTAAQYIVRTMLEATRDNPMDKLPVQSIRALQNVREALRNSAPLEEQAKKSLEELQRIMRENLQRTRSGPCGNSSRTPLTTTFAGCTASTVTIQGRSFSADSV